MGQCNLNKNRAPIVVLGWRLHCNLMNSPFGCDLILPNIDSGQLISIAGAILRMWFLLFALSFNGDFSVAVIIYYLLTSFVRSSQGNLRTRPWCTYIRAEVWDYAVMTERTRLILSYLLYGLFIISVGSRPWDGGGGGGYLSTKPLDKRGGGPPGPLPGLNDRQP